MHIGKREQIVFILIGLFASIALIHMFIFKPRADAYAETAQKYNNGISQIKDAQIPPSANYIKVYEDKTKEYSDQLSNVVAQLNLGVPEYFMSVKPAANAVKIQATADLLKELVKLRPGPAENRLPRLTFLGNPSKPNTDQGWNLPDKLPNIGVGGALWDTVIKLQDRWVLQNSISDPIDRIKQRVAYNDFLKRLGIDPAEVSDYVTGFQPVGYVFYNDAKLVPKLPAPLNNNPANPLSINRFGVLVPALKKLYMSELIWENRDPNTQMTKERLREILEVNLPTDNGLLVTNKELAALIDIIKMGQQDGVQDITRVNLLKLADIGKAKTRSSAGGIPKATPTPVAPVMGGIQGVETPVPVVAAADKIGAGAGLEIGFLGSNSNMVNFLFDITHTPRTYALDDLYIQASPDNVIQTSTTVELVSTLNNVM